MNQAEQNADIVRRGYAAFNSGDMKTLTAIFDEQRLVAHAGARPPRWRLQGT